MSTDAELWWFLLWGYLVTVAIETPLLLIGLSRRHTIARRVLAGVWLNACSYPIVILVLPILVEQHFGRLAYLAVAETFAPVAECGLFYAAFLRGTAPARRDTARDMLTIVMANAASFGVGELLLTCGLYYYGVVGG